jgi:hypothetical protein
VKIAGLMSAILFASLIPMHLASCGKLAASSSDATATDAWLMAKAEATSSAVSALESLDKGDIKVARSTLEAQVVSGIAVLRGMEPEKTPVSAVMVDEAVAEAEAYLKKHNLSVPEPAARN